MSGFGQSGILPAGKKIATQSWFDLVCYLDNDFHHMCKFQIAFIHVHLTSLVTHLLASYSGRSNTGREY